MHCLLGVSAPRYTAPDRQAARAVLASVLLQSDC